MFSHVTLGTRDPKRAAAFFDRVLAPLGIERVSGQYKDWAAWQRAGDEQKFWVGLPYNQRPAGAGNGTMVAFAAKSRPAVDAAHAAAMAAGAFDEGAPGLRPSYGPDYYGASVRDDDGNKIHFVCREPQRSST